MTYLPNRLNEYETYTYNIRLYMVDPIHLNQMERVIDTSRSILLVDNAREARYNINNLEHVFALGHKYVREAISNRFSMTIQEPNGVTLLERIRLSADRLSIPNYLEAGYLIAIDFHGRKQDGRANKFKPTFYFPAIITNFDFQVTEGGTTYNIDMSESNTIAYRYMQSTVKEQITVEARTVGEFISEFQKKYNESIFNAWAVNPSAGALRDEYVFEFDETTEDWKNWEFEILNEEFTGNNANFVGLPGQNPKLQITANNGSNVASLISQVLQLTAEYKKILLTQDKNQPVDGSNTLKNSPEEHSNKPLESFPTFYKLIPSIEYLKFDVLANKYQKRIKYKIKAYVVTDEIVDSTAYRSTVTNARAQDTRVNNLIANDFLRKRYDYYYTGKNSEVLELDMKFDSSYFYVTPYGDGYYGEADVASPQYYKDREEVISRVKREMSDARLNVKQKKDSLNRAIYDSQARFDGPQITGLQNAFDQALSEFENLVEQGVATINKEYDYKPGSIDQPLRFIPDVIPDDDMVTSDNNRKSGNLKFGAVKVNLENPADLLSIELGIRGDPYWIGVPNSYLNRREGIDELADYESGSINFFLNVNFPTTNEDKDGRRKPSPDYLFSGLYTVRNVINRFQGGQFTQYLSAVRDLATNTSTVYEKLKNNTSLVEQMNFAREASDAAQRFEDSRPSGNTGNN